jgi:hypothetical protein
MVAVEGECIGCIYSLYWKSNRNIASKIHAVNWFYNQWMSAFCKVLIYILHTY